jgi:hypothetical protein
MGAGAMNGNDIRKSVGRAAAFAPAERMPAFVGGPADPAARIAAAAVTAVGRSTPAVLCRAA